MFALTVLILITVTMPAIASHMVSIRHESVAASMWTVVRGIGLDWSFTGLQSQINHSVRTVALITNMGGLGMMALLVESVADAVNLMLENLRRGFRTVVERDHTMIIGWNSFTPCFKIVKANASIGGGCIVKLAKESRKFMESELESHYRLLSTHSCGRVIC